MTALMSDKQAALVAAAARVFPHAWHGFCQVHYFKNASEPVADADEAMKKHCGRRRGATWGQCCGLKAPKTLGF